MSSQYSGVLIAGAAIGIQALIKPKKRGIYNTQTQKAIYIPDATIEERHHDEMEITEHPVEQGTNIADHAFKRPSEVVLKCAWSDSPKAPSTLLGAGASLGSALNSTVGQITNVVSQVQGVIGLAGSITSSLSGNNQSLTDAIYAGLKNLQISRQLFDLYTGKYHYTNMLLKVLAVDTDKTTENALYATLICREIILVNTTLVSMNGGSMMFPQDAPRNNLFGTQQLNATTPGYTPLTPTS